MTSAVVGTKGLLRLETHARREQVNDKHARNSVVCSVDLVVLLDDHQELCMNCYGTGTGVQGEFVAQSLWW